MENNQEPQEDPQGATEPPVLQDSLGAEEGGEREKEEREERDKEDQEDKGNKEKEEEKENKEKDEDKEKEEEEAFLFSLYKFMKERHTPIERIPHLGFKQINLWKIYKAVEKLGAYELVTGRRLWKNVYDELGGSPGSTSAATCTRRHYERLVLPYVRHLKGEEDKPLPPSKPRRQYKVCKDDKNKRARKDKGREQVPTPDRGRAEEAPEEAQEEAPERGQAPDGHSSPATVPSAAPSPSGSCPRPCRTHSETYKRLFSSFYSKGNHPIMSPLAKKKLLAQVSEAEALHCRKRHCPEGHRAPSHASPEGHRAPSHASPEGHQAPSHAGPEPPRPLPSPRLAERRSPEPSGAPDRAASVGSEVGAAPSPSPAGRDSQGCPRAEHGAPAVFTGYFHAYRSEGLQPPLWGYFSNLKDFLEPPCAFPARPEEPEQPRELRSQAGPAWDGRGAAVQACWVPPGASFGLAEPRAGHGHHEEEEEDEEDDVDEEEEEEEEPFGPTKSHTVSPLAREGRDRRPRSPGGHQGLAKPRAVVATAAFPAPPDAFQGASLHFPGGFGTPLEHLRTQGVPLAPALSASPLVIPAFPSPLLLASARPPELCQPLATGHGRLGASSHGSSRLYAAAPWHSSCSSFPQHGKP